jgi:hypothetical protein
MLSLLTLPPVVLKLLTFAPAAGYLGHALYSLTVTHDIASVGSDLAAAAAIVGIGGAVHSQKPAAK